MIRAAATLLVGSLVVSMLASGANSNALAIVSCVMALGGVLVLASVAE